MKNYFKKLLVGLLVAAMTVTNIDYVPVMAKDLAVGDNLITSDEKSMASETYWDYDNAWYSEDSKAGFSSDYFAIQGGTFYGDAEAVSTVRTKENKTLKVGTYTVKFKGYGENVTVYPYVGTKNESSSVSLTSNTWGTPGEFTLTFSVSEEKNASIGLVFAATSEYSWYDVSDISVTYTSTEVPVEKEYWIAGKEEAFGANWKEVKMTKESDGTYSYELGYLELGDFEATVYYDESWGTVKWFSSIPIAAAGYVKVFATIDEEAYDNSTIVAKVYTDANYKTEVEVADATYYVGFSDDLTEANKMTKETDGKYALKCGQVSKGEVEFGIYPGLADGAGNWPAATVGWNKYNIANDGYGKIVYNPKDGKVNYLVYSDSEYTKEIFSGDFTIYYNNDDITDAYFLFAKEVNHLTSVGELWGRKAYKLDKVKDGWFSLNLNKEDLKEFQIVKGLTDSDWVANVGLGGGGTDEFANIKAVEGATAYISSNASVVAATEEAYNEAIGNVEDEYYIAGSTGDWQDAGIFPSNYGLTKLTKDEEGKYYIELGSINEGEEAKYKVLKGNGWDNVMLGGSEQTYVAPGTGYVKMVYDPETDSISIKLYTDSNFTELVKVVNKKATLYVYYPGNKDVKNDTLTIAFAKNVVNNSQDAGKLGKAYKETYWTRSCYPLKKVKANWYTFDVYKDYGGFQIVANPHSEATKTHTTDDENTTWIIDFGNYGDVTTADVDNEKYDALFDKEVAYVMYNTLFDSIEDAEAHDKAHNWDFYIAGSTGEFEPKCDKGIFSNYWAQDNYHKVEGEDRYTGDANWLDKMTKSSDNKKLTWTSKTKAKKFESYALNVYADKSWFGKVWKNNYSFLSVADAYVRITYDFAKSEFSVEYFEDDECKEPTEFDDVAIYYYYGETGAKDLYLAFNATIPGKKSIKTYWGRKCYPMTEVGKGWYVFKGYKAIYGGYQVVVNPQNENFSKGDKDDKKGTKWQTDIGDYGDISTSDSDLSRFKAFLKAGKKVYIKYNKVFKTQNEADSFTNWTYYVAGSTSDFTNTNAGKGIFSNYWAGTYVKGVDDDGKAYEKKEDTWPDVLTKEKDNVYSVKLGRAIKGTTYSFNVYTEKDWNASNLTGAIGAPNPEFKATSNNYVKLYFYRDLKKGNNTWAIKYFADKDCKVKAKLSAPKGVKVKSLKATKGAKVKLSWKAVAGASKYVIYANGKKVASTKKTSKAINYKKAGKTIKYTVVAKGNEYAASKASKAVKVKTPGKIKKIKAKGVKGAVKVTWKKVKKSNGYVIYRSTKKKKGFKKIGLVKGAKKTKFLDKKAAKGKKYFYKVYTFKKNGKKAKVYSKASKVASAKSK